jgi:hypothetical protein
VHGRQVPPLRAVELPSGTQLDRVVRGMTWCWRRVGQVQRPNARQTAIALLLLLLLLMYDVRDVCGDRGEVERLGFVLRIGGRRLALLLLLHDADCDVRVVGVEAATPRFVPAPRESYKRRRSGFGYLSRLSLYLPQSIELLKMCRRRGSMRYRTPRMRGRRCRRELAV